MTAPLPTTATVTITTGTSAVTYPIVSAATTATVALITFIPNVTVILQTPAAVTVTAATPGITVASATTPPPPTAIPPGYFTVVKRYPPGPITPAGAYHLLAGDLPTMKYRSYDNTCVFAVYGGEAIYDPTMPESVQVTDLKGLMPPWQNITQKGATQDGETYIDSLYDPIMGQMSVRIRGRDAAHTRMVQRDWLASWDAKQPGTLSWFDQALGYWWAKVQFAKSPLDRLTGGNWLPQSFVWPFVAYNAFWQSFDCVDSFGYTYDSGSDNFGLTTANGLSGWTISYSAPGGWLYETTETTVAGYPVNIPGGGGQVLWMDDPNTSIGTGGVNAVAINDSFTSSGDDQVVAIQLGSTPTWWVYGGAYDDIWVRCAPAGSSTPGQYGVRARIGQSTITLSYFLGGAETVMRSQGLLIAPIPGEWWTLVCSGDTFIVTRGTSPTSQSTVMTVVEQTTLSPKGAAYRAAGMGMGVALDTTPASIFNWTAGDDPPADVQGGFLAMTNMGDQPMFPRFTLYAGNTDGAVFTIQDGANNSGNDVTFGPMVANQIVQLRTDPRNRGVTDLTTQPASPQALTKWQTALEDFLSFAIGNNTIPLVAAIESLFGIVAPQGNVYSLLNGRFSDNSAIPAKPVAGTPTTYEIPVSVSNGNSTTAIYAAATPLRRSPY